MFTDKEILNILKQLIEGVGYLHENGIMHRDIKPDNILLKDKKTIVLTDFGLATEIN